MHARLAPGESRQRKKYTRHGMHGTREYKIWSGMRRRCVDPRYPGYLHYGARGITVCQRWDEAFENFYADLGPCPGPEYSLDRIDPTDDYCPENCRWATREEQENNKIDTVFYEMHGEVLSLKQWAQRLGMAPNSLLHRIRVGWPLEEALTTPPIRRHRKSVTLQQSNEVVEKFLNGVRNLIDELVQSTPPLTIKQIRSAITMTKRLIVSELDKQTYSNRNVYPSDQIIKRDP